MSESCAQLLGGQTFSNVLFIFCSGFNGNYTNRLFNIHRRCFLQWNTDKRPTCCYLSGNHPSLDAYRVSKREASVGFRFRFPFMFVYMEPVNVCDTDRCLKDSTSGVAEGCWKII